MKAYIELDEDPTIIKLFEAEDKKFKNNRSNYNLTNKNNKIIFEINADDATALRSTLDSICKGLKVYEDMKKIK